MTEKRTIEIREPVHVIPKAKLVDVQGNARSPDYISGVHDAWRIALSHASEHRAEADNVAARAASAIARDIFKLSERSVP